MNRSESMRAEAEARRMASYARSGSARSVRVTSRDGAVRSEVASEAYRRERARAENAAEAPKPREQEPPDHRFCG